MCHYKALNVINLWLYYSITLEIKKLLRLLWKENTFVAFHCQDGKD